MTIENMNNRRMKFYNETIYQWIPQRSASILIIGGGKTDHEVFNQLGFSNVTISNIDVRLKDNSYSPFLSRRLDAENLDCPDNAYDFVVAHATLHHCASPHRALLEMYRVAKIALILIENRDSVLMRQLVKLGFSANYEIAAVTDNDCCYGGLRNTQIPNYVYRWTEREIEKTISTYAPHLNHLNYFTYRYGFDIPSGNRRDVSGMRNSLKRLLVDILTPAYWLMTKLFPRQQNLFACKIKKPEIPGDLQPWLLINDKGNIVFNDRWVVT